MPVAFFFENPYRPVKTPYAIAVLTEWDEFATYDWQNIEFDLQNQLLFFDGRNLLNGPELQEIGFVYQAIGS
jgi:UDPglucose 6-dehydrogenase